MRKPGDELLGTDANRHICRAQLHAEATVEPRGYGRAEFRGADRRRVTPLGVRARQRRYDTRAFVRLQLSLLTLPTVNGKTRVGFFVLNL